MTPLQRKYLITTVAVDVVMAIVVFYALSLGEGMMWTTAAIIGIALVLCIAFGYRHREFVANHTSEQLDKYSRPVDIWNYFIDPFMMWSIIWFSDLPVWAALAIIIVWIVCGGIAITIRDRAEIIALERGTPDA